MDGRPGNIVSDGALPEVGAPAAAGQARHPGPPAAPAPPERHLQAPGARSRALMTALPPAIVGVGFALPDLRVPMADVARAWGHVSARDVERRALPAFDEDEVTLAAAAAGRALAASGLSPHDVGLVLLATGGAAAGASTVAEALGARNARALDVVGRRATGLAALVTAFDTVAAAANVVVLVAADVPRAAPGDPAEHGEGAAAAACVVARGRGVALAAAEAATADLPGAPRLDAEGALRGPDVAVEDAGLVPRVVEGALAGAGALDFVLARAAGTARGADGKPLAGARAAAALRPLVGDAGVAGPLLDLVQTLGEATPGTEGLALASDAGLAVALRLRVEARPAGEADVARAASGGREATYLRALQERGVFLAGAGIPDEPMGAYVSLPDFARSLPQRYRLVGARCRACGALAFPPRAACLACGGGAFDASPLSGRGTVHAFTVIGRGGAPSEYAAEQAMTGEYVSALVDLAEGPRVAARLAGVAPADVRIGLPVRAILRRLYAQQGVVRYGFKFAPA